MYTEIVYDHFMNPRNAYLMENSNGEGQVGDPACGDSLMIFIRVENNVLEEVSYLVYGCPASIATSSMTSVLVKGKTIEEALSIREKDIINALGGLPKGKEHCSNLGVSALKKAIEIYKENNKNNE